MNVKSLSHVQLFVTPWTAAYLVLPSMGFSRQEYWSGLPFPPPVDPSNTGTESVSFACVSCVSRWVLYHLSLLGSPINVLIICLLSQEHKLHDYGTCYSVQLTPAPRTVSSSLQIDDNVC